MADLGQLKKDFSQLVLKVPQWTLTQFVLWLDLKVAEFKVNGYMVLDDTQRTLPRWIDDDVLEVQETAPKHKHCRPCGGYKHAKRRKKWKHWHGWGMPYGFDMGHHHAESFDKVHHHPEGITSFGEKLQASMGENIQDNTPVEISDESDNSDFEYVTMDMPHGPKAPPGNEPQKPPFEKYSHKHWLQRFSPHRLKVSKSFNVKDTTESVCENVNQISISNEGVRPKQSLMDVPPCQSRIYPILSVGDNSSRNTSRTCTPERCQIDLDEPESTVTSSATTAGPERVIANTPESVSKNQEQSQENEAIATQNQETEKSQDSEAMVIQESEAVAPVLDVKPDIVLLEKELVHYDEGEDQDLKDIGDLDDKKFDLELMPLSPVTSALMNYHGMKHCRRHAKLPIEQPAMRQTNVVPDLLDETTKRYLLAGHGKLVWNKVVGACASFLVHACKGQPSSSDYQWLCKTMYDKYPSLGSNKGPNPWSGFNRAVSQKIRHTRFKIKQMRKMSTKIPPDTCMFS